MIGWKDFFDKKYQIVGVIIRKITSAASSESLNTTTGSLNEEPEQKEEESKH